jgi:hypothetical protein
VGEHPRKVNIVLGVGLNPEVPADQSKELEFKEVHLSRLNSSHGTDEMVPIKDVIVKLRGKQYGAEDKPIKEELVRCI